MSNQRRTRGEGSISKRTDGRYMGRYRVTEPDGTRKTRAVYADTKAECAKKLRHALSQVDNGIVSIGNNMSVEGFYNLWRSSMAPNYLKPTTLEQYDIYFRDIILPKLGKKKLNTLSMLDVQKMINYILRTGGSPKKCLNCRNALSSALTRAKRHRLIAMNPARGIELPHYEPKEKVIWNMEQVGEFLKCAQATSSYYAIYKILSYFGLREGEALGIRAEDVVFNVGANGGYGVLSIRQQVVQVGHRPVIQTPKTKSSIRDLPHTQEVADLLRPLVERTQTGLLFHTASGKPISPRNFYRDYCKVVCCSGLPHASIHNLRHSACTFLRDAGVDPKTAQVIMGHSDPSITLRIYQHSGMEDKLRGFEKLNNLYSLSGVATQA